jgi:hypothetical protein
MSQPATSLTTPSAAGDSDVFSSFDGYGQPTYTMVPNLFLDWQTQDLTLAETRVILYLFRHTYGRHQPHAAIPVTQIMEGLWIHDPSTQRKLKQIDRGAGVECQDQLDEAVEGLVTRQLVFRHVNQGSGGGRPNISVELNIDGRPHQPTAENVVPRGPLATGLSVQTSAVRSGEQNGEPEPDSGGTFFRRAAYPLHLLPRTLDETELAQEQERVSRDTDLIMQHLGPKGMRLAHAQELARLAASRATPPEYVGSLIEYVTHTQGVQNPIALFEYLCRNNQHRSLLSDGEKNGLRRGWIARVRANPHMMRHAVLMRLRDPDTFANEPSLEEIYPELADVITALTAEIRQEEDAAPAV